MSSYVKSFFMELFEPEKTLLREILFRALNDFVSAGHVSEADREDATIWLMDEADQEFGSFASVCYALGLDAAAIRRSLKTTPTDELRSWLRHCAGKKPRGAVNVANGYLYGRKVGGLDPADLLECTSGR